MKDSGRQAIDLSKQRRDRLIRELNHDPYHSKLKIKAPAVCPECGAVYLKGRWTWEIAPDDASNQVCPACLRIKDRVPAAFLTLRGEFVVSHADEILNLISNYEQRERKAHPLKRVMGCEEQADGFAFTLTDAHLARGIGDALERAYEGELDYQYTKEDTMLRVTWVR